MNVTYLSSGGKVGDTLKAVVSCDKFGKTLAYTSIQFTNSKGEIAARGSHTKYVQDSLPNPFSISMIIRVWITDALHRYVAQAWKHADNIVEELSPRPAK